jgi:hypothetical protein
VGRLSDWRARAKTSKEGDLAPGEGISLHQDNAINLGYVRDLHALLRGIEEAMPEDAVLYLEGTSIAREIEEFLRLNAVEPVAHVTSGTAWPKPRSFHLPTTRPVLGGLRERAAGHAAPELCDHLVVYRDDEVLLSAYDAGAETVWVRRDLPEESLARLRELLSAR